MANPTGAVSAKKTGKPRKKAELAHFEQIGCEQAHYEQAHCEQAHCEQTHCEQAGPVGAKSNQAGLEQKGQTTAFNKQKDTLVLTNCTNSPRGIAFKNGIVILQPREMRVVPADQQQEVRDLFKNPTFQRFVDHGIFRLSSIGDDEQSTVVKTPPPPEALTKEVCVNELQMAIGTRTGSRASGPKVVAYQQGGALPEANNTGTLAEIN